MPVDGILGKLVKGNWQAAVVVSAMVGQLNLHPVENSPRSKAQYPEGCRLHHIDGAPRKLATDSIPAAWDSIAAHAATFHSDPSNAFQWPVQNPLDFVDWNWP
jgi:hypothetical protein